MYSSSKFAVEGLTEALALKYKPLGIRIVSVAPGAYDTAFGANTDNYIEAGDAQLVEHSRRLRDHFAAVVASRGEPQDPREVADKTYECVTADEVPVHNPVDADAQRLTSLLESSPTRQDFIVALERMLLPPTP